MTTSRRAFIQTSAAAAQLSEHKPGSPPAALDIARRHSIRRHKPTPNFFEGMLLGNGDIGVCAVLRPDALGIHIGKSDVWDIRVSEDHVRHVLPFSKILEMWRQAGDEAKRRGDPNATFLETRPPFDDYQKRTRSSYAKPWPRPWPCGTVWVHFDARQVTLLEQRLDLSNGLLTFDFLHDNLRGAKIKFTLQCFVARDANHISISSSSAAPILSVAYYPRWDPNAQLPEPLLEANPRGFLCTQLLPATAPTDQQPKPPASPDDRTFALSASLAGNWKPSPVDNARHRVHLAAATPQPFRLDLALFTTFERPDAVAHAPAESARLASQPVAALQSASAKSWARFWSHSAVELADPDLEDIWYRNQYWLACCLKPGKVAPGLFGNWSSGNIGTAWHGDYHMNYNSQQVWWGVFSSNHVEQHEPYTRLIESLMPMAEWNARVQFSLPGAYFPHSAYPVPSKVNPYPVPPWGYEICETPWAVQSLWWQYLYTLDKDYLKRVYPILRAATDFLMAYMKKGDDGKFHIIPSVSPENWGMTVDFRLNRDCIIDLALTEFLLDAMVEASRLLNVDANLRPLWDHARHNMAPYPQADGPYGKVWLDVLDAPVEYVYNVPVTLSPVFPCERTGLGLRPELLDIATRTTRTVRLEGGNDLVWQPMVRARLGILDLSWFKREVAYCTLPNGVANDRTRQIGGRYRDETNPDFMMQMGVWTENLSLPAVLNECLLQSYSGIIRLFPNNQGLGPARFANLRAAGAFLVSSAWDGRTVTSLTIHSEKGAPCRLLNPWPGSKPKLTAQGRELPVSLTGDILQFPTTSDSLYSVSSH